MYILYCNSIEQFLQFVCDHLNRMKYNRNIMQDNFSIVGKYVEYVEMAINLSFFCQDDKIFIFSISSVINQTKELLYNW